MSGPPSATNNKKSTPSTMSSNNTNTTNSSNNNNTSDSLASTISDSATAPPTAANKLTTTSNNNPNITSASQLNATSTNGNLSDSVASTIDGLATPSNSDQLSKTNLYIKGLSTSMRDHDLVKMCSRYGTILSTKAIVDKSTGYCRGYGFVEFSSPQAAEHAVLELTKTGIQAQMARISTAYSLHNNNLNHHGHYQNHRHQHHNNNGINHNNNHSQSQYHNNPGGNNSTNNSSSSNGNINNHHQHHNNNNNHSHNPNSNNHINNSDPTNLYIANLPPQTSEQELENLLSTFGPVVSTRILRDPVNNIPRGVGFARMESRDKCEQIIEQLNGRPYKGWKEPLLVKFADGGNKKRQHQHQHHNQQSHHHNHNNHGGGSGNNNHQTHHKVHQDDSRWRESGGGPSGVEINNQQAPSYDHQGNIPHSNHPSDLAMMNAMGYPRLQPGYPAALAPPGNPYAGPMGPSPGAPQWIHAGAPAPYVIPQHMIQPGNMGPSNQAAMAPAALHYGHIPQLTSQMQSLTIAHTGPPVGGYHMGPPQWSPIWSHPIPQQAQASARLPSPMQPSPPTQHQQQPPMQPQQQQDSSSQQQPSNQASQQQAPFLLHHQPPAQENKLQVSMPL